MGVRLLFIDQVQMYIHLNVTCSIP